METRSVQSSFFTETKLSIESLVFFIFNFKLIPQLDNYSSIVNFAQTLFGKLFFVSIFTFGIYICSIAFWKELGVIFLIISIFPQHRKYIIVVATLYWLFEINFLYIPYIREVAENLGTKSLINWSYIKAELILSILLFCMVFYYLALKYRHIVFFRRPVTTLIVFYVTLIAVTSYLPLPDMVKTYLWGFIFIFKRFLWFLAYSLLDIKSKTPTPYFFQMGYYQAFWQGPYLSTVPFPKGASYLKKIECKTDYDFAVCQLKAIKLLYWAFILMLLHTAFAKIAFNETKILYYLMDIDFSFNLPHVHDVVKASSEGKPYPSHIGWAALVAKLINVTLYTATMGHVIIACVRMTGFNALRSTYKPFSAKTLADFWNRYFYYFKELLVEFFFYPVYLRYFKQWPRFRLFFATMCAAGAGNVIFHFLYEPHKFYEQGFSEMIVGFQVYAFYGLIFGAAIGLSQLRNHKNRGQFPWHRRWITGPLCVFGFFTFVIIFDDMSGKLTLADHFQFTLELFGLG